MQNTRQDARQRQRYKIKIRDKDTRQDTKIQDTKIQDKIQR